MGQYYKAVLKNNDSINIYDKCQGDEWGISKLMEHSYIGVGFMDAVSSKLYNEAKRVAWVGDYADEEDTENITGAEAVELKKLAWNHDRDDYYYIEPMRFDYTGKFLVNHDKKIYINMNEYIKDNMDADDWTTHPLSLLTALGNGKGGGDYHGTMEKEIGTWTMDLVEFKDEAPKGYMEKRYIFISRCQTTRKN